MKLKVKQWGSSKAVIVPKALLDLLDIKDEINVETTDKGLVVSTNKKA